MLRKHKQKSTPDIVWFSEVGKKDVGLVGGKGANLGEMYQADIPVPNGFIVTADAYFDFIKKTSLVSKIKSELKDLNTDESKKLFQASENIKKHILAAPFPKNLAKKIEKYYHELSGSHDQYVAVRSSATAEDLPDASFAGQQATFLNVKGGQNVVKAVQKCWASLFEPRAIFYRTDKGYGHLKVGIAVPIQLMIEAEASGVMFTIDPLTHDQSKVAIEAVYGLGEGIVSGAITPDQYLVDKEKLVILEKRIINQDWQITKSGKTPVSAHFRGRQKISDLVILSLAKIGKQIEEHYQYPQDVEWIFYKGKLTIVQTRPVTTIKISKREGDREDLQIPVISTDKKPAFASVSPGKILLQGLGASPGIAAGPVRIVPTVKALAKVKQGDVLVAKMTKPDYVAAMKRAVAIVTDIGGRTSHAAIVSRELGIPCVVAAKEATQTLKDGQIITVDGSSGQIYEGPSKDKLAKIITAETFEAKEEKVDYEKLLQPVAPLKTATKVYVNLGEPDLAAEVAQRNVDGVGLLRAEFMIAEIGVHPRKIIEDKKQDDFVNHLANNLAKFCDAFKPRPIIYRATDFKSAEYRNLKGGDKYEQIESNPMLGFRGAIRYIIDPKVFALELRTFLKVRNKFGFKNLHIMVPFVHTPNELLEVKKVISATGLRRSANFQIWMMVEIPANVILLEQFLKVGIDGISIGSNDLTMLTLGVDRDNPAVASAYNERDPALLWMFEKIIKTCHKYKVTSSICGQAPSDYPDLVESLVKWGVTSVSVNPDAIDKARKIIYEAEKKAAGK